jgi:hypothetical protein
MTTLAATTGIVLAPVVWLATLEAKFALVPFACWFGWRALLHVATVMGLLIVLATGFVAWQSWQAAGGGSPFRLSPLSGRRSAISC